MNSDRWLTSGQLKALIDRTTWRQPIYRDLAERIRLLVTDGQLPDGFRMPSERDLSLHLNLSRTTVTNCYALLRDLGVLAARRGAGNFITQPAGSLHSDVLPTPSSGDADQALLTLNAAALSAPPGLARAYQAAAEQLPAVLSGSGYFPDGVSSLREALADWFTTRGIPTRSDQLIITVGSLSAWNVVLQTMVDPGDPVLLESPTYYNAIEACRRIGARIVSFPITHDDWNPDRLRLIVEQSNPRLALLIPEFQNPTGHWLDEDQRRATARLLNRQSTIPVIDETLLELTLDGDELRTPMASLLDRAITIGSASKSFWGGLRVGWIRSPRPHVRRLIETQATLDNGAAPFEQLVTAQLRATSDQILTAQRDRIRSQRDHLVAAMREHLPEWQAAVPAGGLSLWFRLPTESSSMVSALARQHNLILTPGQKFYPRGGGRRHVRIPYVAEPAMLGEAVRRLESVWQETCSGGTPRQRQQAQLII